MQYLHSSLCYTTNPGPVEAEGSTIYSSDELQDSYAGLHCDAGLGISEIRNQI